MDQRKFWPSWIIAYLGALSRSLYDETHHGSTQKKKILRKLALMRIHNNNNKDMQIRGLLSYIKIVLERKYSRNIPQGSLVYLSQANAGQVYVDYV